MRTGFFDFRQIVSKFIVTAILVGLAACGPAPEKEETESFPIKASGLEGTWLSSCQPNADISVLSQFSFFAEETLELRPGRYTKHSKFYEKQNEDGSCMAGSRAYTLKEDGEMKIQKLNQRLQDIETLWSAGQIAQVKKRKIIYSAAPQSVKVVNEWNLTGTCHIKNWKLGEFRNVTNRDCAGAILFNSVSTHQALKYEVEENGNHIVWGSFSPEGEAPNFDSTLRFRKLSGRTSNPSGIEDSD